MAAIVLGIAVVGVVLELLLHFTGWESLQRLLLLVVLVLGTIIVVGKLRWARFFSLSLEGSDAMSGVDFESYVARHLRLRGFATKMTPVHSDFGADIIATRRGKRVAVQVKHFLTKKVDRRAISDAVAAKEYYGCAFSMVVTNSAFTPKAREFAKVHKTILIDRELLARWIRLARGSP